MKKIKKYILGLFVFLITTLWLYPFYLIIINSFKTKSEIFQNTLSIPKVFTLSNYVVAFEKLDFIKSTLNSFGITILSLLGVVLFSSMCAYALSRRPSKRSDRIYFLIAMGLLVPFQGIMIPLISIFGKANMLNRVGLIIMYYGLASSMSVFLYYGALQGIPKSIDEAAKIDGASTWQVFYRVIFPMLKSTTITIIVLNSIWFWNDYLLPSLVINKPGMYTLPLKMFYFFGEFSKQWHLALAALVIAIIPIIILFVKAQKHVLEGITEGAVK
ncbi:carbohydrate ABC transporter permease [Erysipelothrix urinaevulpis]|uniref:carbohydrate ABC transporter permease n=1 Tax=Erysipelothrix urinaevulpis TaxID=2683717 RepID=UPI00135A1A58|nr:carbohydrate ABC transporter permease [Erysipelothrix urinaevulpis]